MEFKQIYWNSKYLPEREKLETSSLKKKTTIR